MKSVSPLGIKTAMAIRTFTGLADGPFLRRRPAAARQSRAPISAEPWEPWVRVGGECGEYSASKSAPR